MAKKKASSWTKFKAYVKGNDKFGKPVQLTYNGAANFKTWPGAIISTVLVFVMYYFEIALLIDVIMNKTVSLSQDYQHREWSDTEGLALKDRGFEMAFGFTGGDLPARIGTWDIYYQTSSDKIFDDSSVGFRWGKNERYPSTTHQKCSDNDDSVFKYKKVDEEGNDLDMATIQKEQKYNYRNFICSNVFDNTIQGSQFANNYDYIAFEIKACTGNSCASSSEVSRWINSHPLNIVYTDMYKDSSDVNQPVKTYISDPYEFPIGQEFTKNMEFQIQDGHHMEVGKFLKNAITPIFAVGSTREYISQQDDTYFKAIVKLDAKFTVTKRKAYTIQAWFGEIGGLDRMFTKVARWLIGGVAGRLWINAILGSLYMMKQGHDDKKDAKAILRAEARGATTIEYEGGDKEKPSNKVQPISEEHIDLGATISHSDIKLEAKKCNKTLRFVNEQERQNYFSMKKNIDTTSQLTQKGISNIIRNIFFNRQRFSANISIYDKMEQWVHSVICCKWIISAERRVKVHRHQNLFDNGKQVLSAQMDIVKLLRNVRNSRTFMRSKLTAEQQLMLQVQKAELISSSSDHTSDSDVNVPLTGLEDIGHEKLGTVIAFGRISRILRNFSYDDDLEKLDKRLLKGFYTNAKSELVVDSDDQRGIMMNMEEHAGNHPKVENKNELKAQIKARFMARKGKKEAFRPIHSVQLAGVPAVDNQITQAPADLAGTTLPKTKTIEEEFGLMDMDKSHIDTENDPTAKYVTPKNPDDKWDDL